MSFQDHFSKQAADYAAYRPHYPDNLYAWLAEQAPGREGAWDCATDLYSGSTPGLGHFLTP